MVIRRILCPTDLSGNSKAGVAFAVSLARERKAALKLMHIVSPSAYDFECLYAAQFAVRGARFFSPLEHLCRAALAELNRFAQSHFSQELAEIEREPGVEIENTASQIVTTALREEVDLIVMAKRKRGILPRMVSPSNSEAVSREAPCPVLTLCPPKISTARLGGSRP